MRLPAPAPTPDPIVVIVVVYETDGQAYGRAASANKVMAAVPDAALPVQWPRTLFVLVDLRQEHRHQKINLVYVCAPDQPSCKGTTLADPS